VNDLVGGKPPRKSPIDESLVVAFEAEDGEVIGRVVGWVVVNMVDLDGAARDAALAASPVCSEENRVGDGRRDWDADLSVAHRSARVA
jgi:hypothetical protein